VVDDASQDSGAISNGWSVTLWMSGSGTAAAEAGIAARAADPSTVRAIFPTWAIKASCAGSLFTS
jgi:hypothetical protein